MGERDDAGETVNPASQSKWRQLRLHCLCLIGSDVFSAGAGGSTGWAPAFCASASGRAGSGGTLGGRVPVVTGSAGEEGLVSAPGVDCSGWVACASCCGARPRSSASDRPEMTSPVVTKAAANRKSLVTPRLLLSADISFTAKLFAIPTAGAAHGSPGNLRQTPRKVAYNSTIPASPSSVANASCAPLALQASPATAALPRRRTRISAPSSSRTISTVPSP